MLVFFARGVTFFDVFFFARGVTFFDVFFFARGVRGVTFFDVFFFARGVTFFDVSFFERGVLFFEQGLTRALMRGFALGKHNGKWPARQRERARAGV
jgi:hypothetical protein